jgi:hypothetical protein
MYYTVYHERALSIKTVCGKKGKDRKKWSCKRPRKGMKRKKCEKERLFTMEKKIKTARNEMFIEKNMLLVRVALQ